MQTEAKILVVDDEPSVCEVISRGLTQLGIECRIAADHEQALAAATAEPPALAIVDIHMPGHNGIWLLEQFKERWPDMAVIMLTGETNARIAIDCLKKGAEDYLMKPIDLEELRISVQRALEKIRLLRENREFHHSLEKKVKEKTAQLHQALKVIEETYHSTLVAVVGAGGMDAPTPESTVSVPGAPRADVTPQNVLPWEIASGRAAASAGKHVCSSFPEGVGNEPSVDLAAIRAAGELISQGAPPTEVAEAIATELVDRGGAHFARLWLQDSETPGLTVVVDKGARGEPGLPFAEKAASSRATQVEKWGEGGAVSVPILVRGRAEGVLQVGWKEGSRADRVALTERLALFIAASLARGRGALDLQQEAQCIMDSLHKIVDYDVAGLLLLDEPASLRIQTRVPAGEGFTAPVRTHILNALRLTCGLEVRSDIDCHVSPVEARREQSRPETPYQPRSYVDLPLTVGGGVAGLIHVSRGRKEDFSQMDILFLDRAAHLLTTFVQGGGDTMMQ